jgi:L-asparaginase II
MQDYAYRPILEVTRGNTVETIHFGALAVVDSAGKLIASHGDPSVVTFLRSSAKPFQVLPFIEHGGQQVFGLDPKEVALICSSHSGTDDHVATVLSIQKKSGVEESDLMCGVHAPFHVPTLEAMHPSRGTAHTKPSQLFRKTFWYVGVYALKANERGANAGRTSLYRYRASYPTRDP